MKTVLLLITACIIPGLGAVAGSVVGHAASPIGLWVGGVSGGLLGSVCVAWVAARARWVGVERRTATGVGTAVGFLVAAAVAVNTLSSPVGPIASTVLAGIGAMVGSRRGPRVTTLGPNDR